MNQNSRLTFLRLIGEHAGEWGWYQFERAFPPGWFTDEPATTRAIDISINLRRTVSWQLFPENRSVSIGWPIKE